MDDQLPARGPYQAARSGSQPSASQQQVENLDDRTATVQMILGLFFSNAGPEAAAIEVASWLRVLVGCKADELLTAWEDYQGSGPRAESGALLKPTPHELRRRIMRERAANDPRPALAPPSERDQEKRGPVVSQEAAERILAEAGFTPARMAAVTRAPMARTVAEAETQEIDARRHWSDGLAPDDPRLADLERARAANPLVQSARQAAGKPAPDAADTTTTTTREGD